MNTTPLRGQRSAASFEDEPPAYPYGGEDTISYLDGSEASFSPSRPDNGATMRLLPTGNDDADANDLGRNTARFRMGQTSSMRRTYVVDPRAARMRPQSIYLVENPLEPNPTVNPISSSAMDRLISVDKGGEPSIISKGCLGSQKRTPVGCLRNGQDFSSRPAPASFSNQESKETVPPPLFSRTPTTPKPCKLQKEGRIAHGSVKRRLSFTKRDLFPDHSPSLEPISENREANKARCSANPSPTRASPTRYQPFRQRQNSVATSLPGSRPGSSLGQAPSIPLPTAAVTDSPQYTARPGSPKRPWTPSRGADWARPPAPPSTSSVNYEPPDLNGSPRPGTPSSRYGGSPRRPLPPAPLFAGASVGSGGVETSIDIGDGRTPEDPFGAGGRTIDPRSEKAPSVRSYDSFLSESTMVTEEKEGMSKVKVDLDDASHDTEILVDPNMHYGPAPEGKQSRRGVRPAQMSKKEVQLINGELVLECKIPTILHSFLPRRDEREFTHMRYTAVTSDPDDFVLRGYKLRQNIGSTMRETELFICVTMYNENEILFTRTMHGIMRNISHFCSRSKSRTWGKDGWQKIVVCIIADGRQKVHPRTLNALAAMGVYQDGIAKNIVNQKEVTAHVYEYTTQVSLDSDLKFKGAEKGIVPCQVIFCLKEQNQKKLNSHRWFFNAFGRALEPNVCILLDVGTKPAPTALYHLWKAFDQDSNVAGAAGEIIAGKGKNFLGLFNPLVASQNFEYKMSNILDKPLESVFGYITVLPGALSAYRYYALQNDATGHGPLSQYFKGETLQGKDADVFTANMYLAEDRILCWELVAKRGERWVLKFVKSAVGETDVPDSIPEFISQRRRWLNGAFFAAVYSLVNIPQIWKTDHSLTRKVLLHIEFVYQFFQLIFTYFGLANFYLAFFFIAGSLSNADIDPFGHNMGKYIFYVLRYSCVLLICLQFILSMGNRPQGAKKMFLFGMVVYGVIMFYTAFATIYLVIIKLKGSGGLTLGHDDFSNIIVSLMSTLGLYFIMSFMYLDPWHLFSSSAQYFALLPSYICTLQVYAFCNTHDVTWGTKGDNVHNMDLGAARGLGGSTVEIEMPSEQLDIDSGYDNALRNLRDRLEVPAPPTSESQLQEDYYRAVRTYMVSIWMVANAILAMSVSEAYGIESGGNNIYLSIVLWAVAALAVFRALGSTAFAILNVVHKLAEGRMKFMAGGMSSTISAKSSTVGGSTSYGGSASVQDWISEKRWAAKRKAGKLMFWRK